MLTIPPCIIVRYLKQKGSISGPRFKTPLVGPFLQAIHPKWEGYIAQWASGPLSCVSIFHKYVKPPLSMPFPDNLLTATCQICGARIRPRHCPQGVQVTGLLGAMPRAYRKRHHGPRRLGVPPGASPCRISARIGSPIHDQSPADLPPSARAGIKRLLRQVHNSQRSKQGKAHGIHGSLP